MRLEQVAVGAMARLIPATYALLDERFKEDRDARDNPRNKSGDGHEGPFVGMLKSPFHRDPDTSRGIHAFLARLRH